MKVSTEIDNNFGYEKITQLVDNIPLNCYCHEHLNFFNAFCGTDITVGAQYATLTFK